MRILFTVCGRAGSKGVQNKNIRLFLGRALPLYTIGVIEEYIRGCNSNDCDVVVSTDSEELIDIVNHSVLGKQIEVIRRDKELAGDNIGKIDVIRDCRKQMELKKDCNYDIVVDLDITSPIRTVTDVKNLIDKYEETQADVVFSVVPARRNPYFNQVIRTEHGVKKVIESEYTTRQQAPEIFDMNASMYAYNPKHLDSGKQLLDGYCEIIEMKDTGILDIDHEGDFELMEVIARHLGMDK